MHPNEVIRERVRDLAVLGLSSFLLASASVAAPPVATHAVTAAIYDEMSPNQAVHAFQLLGINTRLIFAKDGHMVEESDGTARLTGVVMDRLVPEKRWQVDVRFWGRTSKATLGSPKLELHREAYMANGGPVDPSTWHYYLHMEGELVGEGFYEGGRVQLSRRGPAFQVGEGASNKNVRYGASGWVDYAVLEQPAAVGLPAFGWGDLNLELHPRLCAERAETGPYTVYPGEHALWLPGIGEDFVFDPGTGELVRYHDGRAELRGVARRRSIPEQAFEVAVRLEGHTQVPPPGSPKKELRPEAYIENGGPVDPSTWTYYPSLRGTLLGLEAFAGAELAVELTGPAFQVGDGANGKTVAFGGSSWFLWEVLRHPYSHSLQPLGLGDLNLTLGPCVAICVKDPAPDPEYVVGTQAASLHLEGIGDFAMASPAQWVERADGTASLQATLHDWRSPQRVLELDLRLEDRTEKPPSGSPSPGLPRMAYVQYSGPVNMSDWWYYPSFQGTLSGGWLLQGAKITIRRRGPAFQVGPGASNRNILPGAGGWLDFEVVRQPEQGKLPGSGPGDLLLGFCPDEESEPGGGVGGLVGQAPMEGCLPTEVVGSREGRTGSGEPVALHRRHLDRVLGWPDGDASLEDPGGFLSLGFGGAVTLGFDAPILNGPGPDLQIFESTYSDKTCEQMPELARVQASADGRRWFTLGKGCQDGAYDLGRLSRARFVRVIDLSDPEAFFEGQAADGFDLDAVVASRCGR